MITFEPLSAKDIGGAGIQIGIFYGDETLAIKAIVSKLKSKGDYLQTVDGYGKYGFTKGILIEMGYMNEAGQWTGMQGFTTQESFLNSESTQETLMDAYLIKLYPQVYGSLITPSTTKADACGILVSAYCLGVENTRLAIVSKSSDTQWVEMYIKMSKQALILNEQLL